MKKYELPSINDIIEKKRKVRIEKRNDSKKKSEEFRKKLNSY